MAPTPQRLLLSRESLEQTASQVALSGSFVLFMLASGVLAAVALISSSVPILIGSMVVAPLMPPLALVPFALAAGPRGEAARGLGVAVVGLLLAFGAALATTATMTLLGVVPDGAGLMDKPLLQERTRPGWWSMAAAVAAGLAGTTAQAHAKTDSLIGSVAALALVPAVGASAVAVWAGEVPQALGGGLLLGMNVALIVGMGVLAVLAPARSAALRPLLLLPLAVVLVVAALLTWAQESGTVPRTPVGTTSGEVTGAGDGPAAAVRLADGAARLADGAVSAADRAG